MKESMMHVPVSYSMMFENYWLGHIDCSSENRGKR
jgi:hypothetical protein